MTQPTIRLDPSTAECVVFTRKEGLLSVIAHDLQIRVGVFAIEIDTVTWHLQARFHATSLRVVGALRNGVVDATQLNDADKRTIEANIVRDVLDADQYPEIRFQSAAAEARGDELIIGGALVLHGRERPIVVSARRDSQGWTAEAVLHQPDFGIRPYSAMLGTLRVQADVSVRITIPEITLTETSAR